VSPEEHQQMMDNEAAQAEQQEMYGEQ